MRGFVVKAKPQRKSRRRACTGEFIRFHGKRHPESMGAVEVNQWLSHLANNRNVAVNTQKTALNAVVFMYHQFLAACRT